MRRKKAVFGRDEVIACLSEIAAADACDALDIRDGAVIVKDPAEIPRGCRCAVASVKNGTGGKGAEIHFYDKLKALDMLCKCLGMYSSESDDAEVMSRLDDVLDSLAGDPQSHS